jgi:RNA helicase HrpA
MDARSLPVYAQRDRILESLKENQVVVVESPTGSGKTTQLPIILHEAGYTGTQMVGITQPRRIAAVSVTEYINQTLGTEELGAYKMRFEDHTTPETRIKVMTDGILLQELKADYNLSHYSVIVVDEAHERSLNIDFVLGLLKRILRERPDFRVIVSSATINAEVFSEYFDHCPVIRIETEMYPVQVIYDPPMTEQGYDAIIYKVGQVVGRVIEEEREGDILIFLTGEAMIKDTIAQLESMPFSRKLHILPLYSRLSKEEQERVFPPPPKGKIKVVVATNIAETSITIDGITTVIDSGLAKLNFYNPRTFTSSLEETPIAKASANQRKGRAGRTRPGTCYRLYSRDDFEARPLFTVEEIHRTDLSEVVLRMAELGIREFDSFDFISSPGRAAIIGAVETLEDLDALEEDNSLSSVGRRMALFPMSPRHSRIIVEGIDRYPDVLEECLIAAAFLTTNTPFVLPQGEEVAARRAHHRYRDDDGDFVSYLKLFQAYGDAANKEQFCESRYLDPRAMGEIWNVKHQLEQIVSDMGVPISGGGDRSSYLCAVSRGLIHFVCARVNKGQYRSLTADRIQIHPGSVMFRENPDFIVAGEIVRTSRMYARSVSPLERSWLQAISPELSSRLLSAVSGKKKEKAKKSEKRDTTWQIQIGGITFQLQPLKGKKKIAVLPWKDLRELLRRQSWELPPQYNNLRAKLVYGKYELMSGAKVPEIIRAAQHVDLENDRVTDWPKQKTFDLLEDRAEDLCREIDWLLKLAPVKKSARHLGFITLQSSGQSQFWFRSTRNFFQAVDESMASLEELADDLPDDIDPACADRISSAYRELAAVYEE